MSDIQARIKEQLGKSKILIYMKGDPTAPMCGFSANTISIFNSLGVEYQTINILEDPDIRQGIKEYSNWPTIPQIYLNGEFIGGNDIITEMHQRGELEPLVKTALEK